MSVVYLCQRVLLVCLRSHHDLDDPSTSSAGQVPGSMRRGSTLIPVWYGSQMGHWPDGMGPFARLAQELEAVSDLFQNL